MTCLFLSIGYRHIKLENLILEDDCCWRNKTETQFFDKNVQKLTSFGSTACFHDLLLFEAALNTPLFKMSRATISMEIIFHCSLCGGRKVFLAIWSGEFDSLFISHL